MPPLFNPNSTDAMFSRILTELKELRSDVQRRLAEGEARMRHTEEDVAELHTLKDKGSGAWWTVGLLVGALSFSVAVFEAVAIWAKG